jgi:hypothetical protein
MIGGRAIRRHAACESIREHQHPLTCRLSPGLLEFLFQPLLKRRITVIRLSVSSDNLAASSWARILQVRLLTILPWGQNGRDGIVRSAFSRSIVCRSSPPALLEGTSGEANQRLETRASDANGSAEHLVQ